MKMYALKWIPLFSIPLATAACGGKATESAAPAPPGAEAQERPGGPGAREEEEASYEDVIEDAESDEGLFSVHKKDEDYLFEIPDSLLGRDMLLISRIAGKMDGMGGFTPAGSAVNRQMLRFERRGDRIMLRKHYGTAVADDTLAIAASVEANYFAPILESWEIEAPHLHPRPRPRRHRGEKDDHPADDAPEVTHSQRLDAAPCIARHLVVPSIKGAPIPSADHPLHMEDIVARIDAILEPGSG